METLQHIYRHFRNHPQISTDSRAISPGAIFFALKGESFDGNLFAADAISNGASLAVVDNREAAVSGKYILVHDVLKCLQDLAELHRETLGCKIIAITGSNGKTTTKELIRAVLESSFRTTATAGNLNNHIGVPLTLLSLDDTTELAIIEMGANHPGEIAALCGLAKPHIGLITNIGKAHLEGFGSFEGVLKAKSELYDYLRSNEGTVMINTDNPYLYPRTSGMKRFSYGTAEQADCRGMVVAENPFLSVQWTCRNETNTLHSNLYGRYNFENIMAAIAAGEYFHIGPQKIIQAIVNYSPSNNRSQVIETSRANKIFMDAYNANPTSMEAAIRAFEAIEAENKMLILGDMLELGEESAKEHQNIISLLEKLRFRNVTLVGHIFNSLEFPAHWKGFPSADQLNHWLTEQNIHQHHILIKGSRKIKLETLRSAL